MTTMTIPAAADLLPAKPPETLALLASPVPSSARAKGDTKTGEQPYYRDWIALMFWSCCFVLMGLLILRELILSLFK
jgi:hypothetical protein